MGGPDILSKFSLLLPVSSCPTTSMVKVKKCDKSTGARQSLS